MEFTFTPEGYDMDMLGMECERLRAGLTSVRDILAGSDYGSLPNDWTIQMIASARMDDLYKLTWQVRDTCSRAEKAEAAIKVLRDENERLRGEPNEAGHAAVGIRSPAPAAPTRSSSSWWEPIASAPLWVHGRDALVARWDGAGRWHSVAMWERDWSREDCIRRGATHWWPHLQLLPAPNPGERVIVVRGRKGA